MAGLPPDPEPPDPVAPFLSTLWEGLERAQTLSSSKDAMTNLPEVLRLCEDAVALIKEQLSKSG